MCICIKTSLSQHSIFMRYWLYYWFHVFRNAHIHQMLDRKAGYGMCFTICFLQAWYPTPIALIWIYSKYWYLEKGCWRLCLFLSKGKKSDVSWTSLIPSFLPCLLSIPKNYTICQEAKQKKNPFLHTIHFKLQNPPKSPISPCSLVPTLQLSSSPSERKKLFFKGLIGCRAMLSNNIPVP